MSKWSMKLAIIVPSLVGVTIGLVVLSIIAGTRAVDIAGSLSNQRVETASRAVVETIRNLEDQSKVVALSTAGNYTVLQSIIDWNADNDREGARANLLAYLRQTASDVGADSFVVRDAEGRIVIRLHQPDNYGDIDGSPAGAAALEGRTTTAFSTTPTMLMGLLTTTPIMHEGEIIGTMAPLYFVYTDKFMEHFSYTFDADVSLYNTETRLVTTLRTATGQPALDVDLSPYIIENVLENGNMVKTTEHFYGTEYRNFYMPLTNAAGAPIGTLSVGYSMDDANSRISTLIRGFIISGSVILIGLIILLYAIINRRTKELPKIAKAAELIAVGDIEIDNLDSGTSPTHNEITLLERSFSKMIESFRKQAYILARVAEGDYTSKVEIRSDKDVINTAIALMLEETLTVLNQVASAGIQVSSGSRQIAEGAQILASGSTEQAATVEQLSTSMSVIAEKTKDNADMAGKAAALAGSIKDNAEKGTHQMGEMMGAVKDINQASQSIGKVIKVIDDIAFQTNILALNAAVEAARAGQHGKGFAVVAEEVRNLAAKSAEAAKDTGGLISNSIEKAELGSRIANDTAASLEEIVAGINESTQIVNDIALSSDEQYQSIKQINDGVEQVARVVQQNSATAQQSAAASEEMSGQSAMLEKLITQFQLGEGGKNNTGRALPPRKPR